MAKYIVTSGAKFNPFSYDELVRPIAEATQAHNATQEQLDTLAMQAGSIASMIGTGKDNDRTRALYDSYMQKLNQVADELYNNGYSSVAANGLSSARKLYGTDVSKIQAAITNRQARADEFRKARLSDPTLIAEYDPGSKGLDNWLDDPQYGNYNSYSGKLLTAQGQQIGEYLKRELQRDETGWKRLLGVNYERVLRNGYTSAEVQQAIANIKTGNVGANATIAPLENAISSIYNSSGMPSWATEADRDAAIDWIGQGIHSAIGEQTRTVLQDQFALADYGTRLKSVDTGGYYNKETVSKPFANYNPIVGANEKEIGRLIKKHFTKQYSNGKTYAIYTPDGKATVVSDPTQASQVIYDNDIRRKAKEEFGGIDIAVTPDSNGLTGVIKDKDGNNISIVIESDVFGSVNGTPQYTVNAYRVNPTGKKVKDKELTEKYNDYRSKYNEYLDEMRKLNKDVNLDGIAISPDEEFKMRKDYNIPDDIPLYSDETTSLDDVLPALTEVREQPEYTIASDSQSPQAYDVLIENLYGKLKRTDGKFSRNDKYGLFEVEEFNANPKDKSVRKASKAGLDLSSSDKLKKSIQGISITPESIMRGNVVINTGKGRYETDANNVFGGFKDFLNYPIYDPHLGVSMTTKDIMKTYDEFKKEDPQQSEYYEGLKQDALSNLSMLMHQIVMNNIIVEKTRTSKTPGDSVLND